MKSGDSLSAIAKKHGVATSALRQANALKSDKIRIGQKLTIPGGAEPKAVVKPAESSAPAAAPVLPAPPVVKPAPAPAEKAVPVVAPPVEPKTPAVAPAAAVKTAPAAVKTAPAEKTAPAIAPVVTPSPAVSPAVGAGTPKGGPATFRTHVVEQDEDIYSVAMMWGVSVDKIKEVNGLTSTALKPGQRLKIPISE